MDGRGYWKELGINLANPSSGCMSFRTLVHLRESTHGGERLPLAIETKWQSVVPFPYLGLWIPSLLASALEPHS